MMVLLLGAIWALAEVYIYTCRMSACFLYCRFNPLLLFASYLFLFLFSCVPWYFRKHVLSNPIFQYYSHFLSPLADSPHHFCLSCSFLFYPPFHFYPLFHFSCWSFSTTSIICFFFLSLFKKTFSFSFSFFLSLLFSSYKEISDVCVCMFGLASLEHFELFVKILWSFSAWSVQRGQDKPLLVFFLCFFFKVSF